MIIKNVHFPHILICDDDLSLHLALKSILKSEYKVLSAYSSMEAQVILKNKKIDLILLDIEMNTPDEGLTLIPLIKDIDGDTRILMMSGKDDFYTVKEALKRGADDFIQKGFEKDELLITLKQNLEKKDLLKMKSQNQFELKTQEEKRHLLIGKSPCIENLRRKINKIKESMAPVMITGETGSGKEVVARQLRLISPKSFDFSPFIAVDSSTIQSTMAESILFGHEKGAFTGATETRKGLFEHADGGILYFDEIGNMPLEIQNKLLRVIQEKEVLRLGSSRPIPLNFRVVCATNKNLEQLCEAGLFKEDLYQRLNVLPIYTPPLRERKEDIPLLIEFFLEKENHSHLIFDSETLELMLQYQWPGNIRELHNTVIYICAMIESEKVTTSCLPPQILKSSHVPFLKLENEFQSENKFNFRDTYHHAMEVFETTYLRKKYKENNGNISKMSNDIKMDRSHLFQKLKSYGIHQSKNHSS